MTSAPPRSADDPGVRSTSTAPTASTVATSSKPPLILRRLLWFSLAVVLIGVGMAWVVSSQGHRAISDSRPLPVGSAVPEFALTRQDGVTIHRSDLLGKVWVADFIFTRCPGPCRELSQRMRSLALSLQDHADDVRLVSFSVDPSHDTPAVLRRYARELHADETMWWFLTDDDEAAMLRLIRQGFFQSVFPATEDTGLIHSNYFLVIGRQGRLRASHDGMDPDSKPLVLADIAKLLAESPIP